MSEFKPFDIDNVIIKSSEIYPSFLNEDELKRFKLSVNREMGNGIGVKKRCICRFTTEDGKKMRTMAWVHPITLEHYDEWKEEDTDDA